MMKSADEDDQIKRIPGRLIFCRIGLPNIDAWSFAPSSFNDRVTIVVSPIIDIRRQIPRDNVRAVAKAAHRLKHINCSTAKIVDPTKYVAPHAMLEIQMVRRLPASMITVGNRVKMFSLA